MMFLKIAQFLEIINIGLFQEPPNHRIVEYLNLGFSGAKR